jgi:UDP-N-acetyl-D-mannosaminuronic acid dehydrogenase
MDRIRKGNLPFIEYEGQPLLDAALASDRIRCSDRPNDVSLGSTVVVTIGTPVDEFNNPEHKAIKACIDGLLPHLRDGQLLVLRSTVYPGTTEWLDGYLKGNGRCLLVSFCPERIVQGHGIRELRALPQIISGTTPEAEESAAQLFSRVSPEIVRVRPLEAEFAKLFSNAYRYLEFAITNQFYMLAEAAGANYHRILRAMKHNYPRLSRIPGPGFAAGPCLFKDTMQLAAFSRNQFVLGHAAMLVNEGLALFVIDKLKSSRDLRETTVGLLGMAFKPEVDDPRASLSYKVKKLLTMEAKAVLTTDPFVTTDPELLPVEQVVDKSDVLILCTPHATYRSLRLEDKPIIDVWNFLDPLAN